MKPSSVIFDAICYQMEQEAEGKKFSLRSLNVMRLFRRRKNTPGFERPAQNTEK